LFYFLFIISEAYDPLKLTGMKLFVLNGNKIYSSILQKLLLLQLLERQQTPPDPHHSGVSHFLLPHSPPSENNFNFVRMHEPRTRPGKRDGRCLMCLQAKNVTSF
jgi:hypothetical protein